MGTEFQAGVRGAGKWALDQGALDKLLAWLNPDREQAGRRYEEIRTRLIKIFTCRGCHVPEDLADETIDRVAKKLEEIADDYSGDPALYFYGVANKVHLEYTRGRTPGPPPPPPREPAEEEDEQEYECLEACIGRLTPGNRDLVLHYYQDEKRAKIDNRRRLAERLGIALNALRIRAHRIRSGLQKCVEECLRQQAAG